MFDVQMEIAKEIIKIEANEMIKIEEANEMIKIEECGLNHTEGQGILNQLQETNEMKIYTKFLESDSKVNVKREIEESKLKLEAEELIPEDRVDMFVIGSGIDGHHLIQNEDRFKKTLYNNHINYEQNSLIANHPRQNHIVFLCPVCSQIFNQKTDLQEHLLRHKKSSTSKQEQLVKSSHKDSFALKKGTDSRKNVWKHEKQEHFETNQVIHRGTRSMEKFADSSKNKCNLKNIKKSQVRSKGEILICHICSHQSTCKDNLQKHVQTHIHPRKVKALSKPERHIKTYPEPIKVYIVPPGTKIFKCKYCDYSNPLELEVRKHIMTHIDLSEVATFQCSACRKQFISKYDLVKHVLVHTNSVSLAAIKKLTVFKCKLCDHSNKQECDLRKHSVVHIDPQNYSTIIAE